MPEAAHFELFIAGRYLRSRRREKVIAVTTVISVVGVAAGVMALIISLAVNNGFQNTLQRNMLAATAHINIVAKEDPGLGIPDWRSMASHLSALPHVVAVAPVLYDQVLVSGARGNKLVTLKGIDAKSELATSDTLLHLKAGSIDHLADATELPGLIVGAKLAESAGLSLGGVARLISPQGTLSPFGPQPKSQRFRIVGIFETHFFDVDDTWAYASIGAVARLLSVGDVVNTMEIRLDRAELATELAASAATVAGPGYGAITWEEQNQELFHALRLERVVTAITIGLIELVGALNILITLTMIVLTKYKDIAVLMSMGARRVQIRRIFLLQGAIIGAIGTGLGLILGYGVCWLAGTYHLIHLDETVYALNSVPFEPRAWDGIWIAAAAIGVSLLATIYPARNATRIAPVEVLRYE
jgi:lipoprotein-releasing system permease protein